MPSLRKIINNPAKIVFVLDRLKISKLFPDKMYLKLKFRASVGKSLNLKNPKTYNEKLQWLKLYDRQPKYTDMVDKYEAKKYVAKQIGEKYVVPTLGIWERVEEIDYESLPNQFVLKCTHDSGGLVICRDKSNLNVENTKRKLERALNNKFYWRAREWPYKNVPPRIIAEKYMEDKETAELRDYKFYCFNGIPQAVMINGGRGQGKTTADYFDMEMNRLDFTWGHPHSTESHLIPKCFEEMKNLAAVLSADIPHVRVDFYEVNGCVYFGELTFFDGGGFEAIDPVEWDYTLGEWLTLPTEKITE